MMQISDPWIFGLIPPGDPLFSFRYYLKHVRIQFIFSVFNT